MKADAKCRWCHRDFADHDYIPNSIDQYKCPVNQQENCYGYFTGGDPRDFHPDYEDSTPEEIANWKRACEEANRIEASRNLPCPSGWIVDEKRKLIAHVLNAPFGIGVCTIEIETVFEAMEMEESER